MNNTLIINKVFHKGGSIPLTPKELAEEAGRFFTESDYPYRISGRQCECRNGGEFELLPKDDPSFASSGGKRYMQCRKCGGWSHL
jgi:hypothetical protein